MPKLSVHIPAPPPVNYPVFIQMGLLRQPDIWLPKKFVHSKIVIITDHIVKKYYGRALAQNLKAAGRQVLLLSFKAKEASKNAKTKQWLEERMLKQGCDRHTLCLALGGGIVGDMGGFIAATYMRGIPLIQIPTSLLAMVDSSIGGKTAINTAYGKNQIGAFWQPSAVVADIGCLESLPVKHRINGLIEAIKMALTSDKKTFLLIEKYWQECVSGNKKIQQNIIERAIKIKAAVVAADEREESGARRILNFGHTIGHALEKVSDYKLLHGYAVAYGILVEAKIAEISGFLAAADYARLRALLNNLGIHSKDLKKYGINQVIEATRRDKKNYSGKTLYILLKSIGGGCYAQPVTHRLVRQAWKTIGEADAGK